MNNMKKRVFSMLPLAFPVALSAAKPNVAVLLFDDLGYGNIFRKNRW